MKSAFEKYQQVRACLEENAEAVSAAAMSRYMKNRFVFYGVKAKMRRELTNEVARIDCKSAYLDWEWIDYCFSDNRRELVYVASDYLWTLKRFLQKDDLFRIRRLILWNPWWDSVDVLQRLIVHLPVSTEDRNRAMLLWSEQENIWLRRSAIIHQLSLREKTDERLLSRIIDNNLGSREFFINKAIGWALRQYGKTRPDWVMSFLNQYREKLSPLSFREASKPIVRKTPISF